MARKIKETKKEYYWNCVMMYLLEVAFLIAGMTIATLIWWFKTESDVCYLIVVGGGTVAIMFGCLNDWADGIRRKLRVEMGRKIRRIKRSYEER